MKVVRCFGLEIKLDPVQVLSLVGVLVKSFLIWSDGRGLDILGCELGASASASKLETEGPLSVASLADKSKIGRKLSRSEVLLTVDC